jgi:2-iminobutanoate/2-iminopropanoate deaminase
VPKTLNSTASAPSAIGPYSQAVKAGKLSFVSGQLPINPKTGDLVEDGIEEKTTAVIENIKSILEEGGATLGSVLKATIFLKNMSDFQFVKDIYSRYFINSLPARSAVAVLALPKGAEIEMEVIALVE